MQTQFPAAVVRENLEPGIVALTLARPERRNALSLALMQELDAALAACGAQAQTRIIILRAQGSVFCAGHDLAELQTADAQQTRVIFDACVALMARIGAIGQPVIAEVGGMATAAGAQLVATCDLVVAAEHASFATPGVRIGLFCSTPMVALSRAIGRKRALEMLLTGEAIDAMTAREYGLVNRVVPAERLGDETLRLARRIAQASGSVLAIGKRAFYEQCDLDIASAYARMAEVMTQNAAHPAAREGISAFLEKRAPQWPE